MYRPSTVFESLSHHILQKDLARRMPLVSEVLGHCVNLRASLRSGCTPNCCFEMSLLLVILTTFLHQSLSLLGHLLHQRVGIFSFRLLHCCSRLKFYVFKLAENQTSCASNFFCRLNNFIPFWPFPPVAS